MHREPSHSVYDTIGCVESALGDPAKARAQLGWDPEYSFERLVETMVIADLDRLRPLAAV